MYADDLILLSISLVDMQSMINICVEEFDSIGMIVNSQKSSCLRNGPPHGGSVQLISNNNQTYIVLEARTFLFGFHSSLW